MKKKINIQSKSILKFELVPKSDLVYVKYIKVTFYD